MKRRLSKIEWLRLIGIGLWIPGAALLPFDVAYSYPVRTDFLFCMAIASFCLITSAVLEGRVSALVESIASIVFMAATFDAFIIVLAVQEGRWSPAALQHLAIWEPIAILAALISWLWLRRSRSAAQPGVQADRP